MARPDFDDTPAMNEDERLTLLDLVSAVDEFADNDAEVMATLRQMFESNRVHFDTNSIDGLPWAA